MNPLTNLPEQTPGPAGAHPHYHQRPIRPNVHNVVPNVQQNQNISPILRPNFGTANPPRQLQKQRAPHNPQQIWPGYAPAPPQEAFHLENDTGEEGSSRLMNTGQIFSNFEQPQGNPEKSDSSVQLAQIMMEMQSSNNKMFEMMHQNMQRLNLGEPNQNQFQNALQEMTRTQQFVSLGQHVLTGDSIFDGTLSKYVPFIQYMCNNVFDVIKDPKWRYDVLMKSCKGEPHEIGQSILSTAGNISEKLSNFLTALNNRYGSVDKIADEMIKEVRKQKIFHHDFESHIK